MSEPRYTKEEALVKLLALGPMEPMHARDVCGWPVMEFEHALSTLLADGRLRKVSVSNQNPTHIAIP